jgi:hypothetical protein
VVGRHSHHLGHVLHFLFLLVLLLHNRCCDAAAHNYGAALLDLMLVLKDMSSCACSRVSVPSSDPSGAQALLVGNQCSNGRGLGICHNHLDHLLLLSVRSLHHLKLLCVMGQHPLKLSCDSCGGLLGSSQAGCSSCGLALARLLLHELPHTLHTLHHLLAHAAKLCKRC